jgi:uncharacterized protein (UPF0179 family)
MKKIISGALAILCVLLMVSCSPNTPTSVAEAYLDDLKDGNYKELVDQMHFKKEMTEQDKAELVKMLEDKATKTLEKKGAIQGYEITSEEISADGNSATVRYTMTYANTKDENEKVKLVKIEDKWVVDSGK